MNKLMLKWTCLPQSPDSYEIQFIRPGGCLARKTDEQCFLRQWERSPVFPPKENLTRCRESFNHHKVGKGHGQYLSSGWRTGSCYLIRHKTAIHNKVGGVRP